VYYFLLVLLLLDALLLMVVVLLQAGKGGGLAAMGAAGAGSDTLFGSRQATTLLTKATWWTGGIFLALAFILSLLSGRGAQADSILRTGIQAPTAPAAAPALPGSLEPAAGGGASTPEEPAAPAEAPQGQ
jgi:preprotein translocase subunit SecG